MISERKCITSRRGFAETAGMLFFMLVLSAAAYGGDPQGSSISWGTTGELNNYLQAKMSGNSTVLYQVKGVSPNADYTIVITNQTTKESWSKNEHSNDKGEFEGSYTMSTPAQPGNMICVSLTAKINGQTVALDYVHILVPGGAPWWAYTIVGTLVYWFQKL